MIFASNRTGDFDIYRKDLHRSASGGSGTLVRLTSTGFYEGTPAVEAGGTVLYRSSDGQKLYRIDPYDPSKGASLVPTTGMIRTPEGPPMAGRSFSVGLPPRGRRWMSHRRRSRRKRDSAHRDPCLQRDRPDLAAHGLTMDFATDAGLALHRSGWTECHEPPEQGRV